MRFSHAQLAEAILQLSREAQTLSSDVARGVLAFVRRRHLTNRLGRMLSAFEQASEQETKHLSISVTSARTLEASEQKAVLASVQHIFPAQHPDLEFHVDPSLLGGLRIETADTRYDGSLARSLSVLAQSLSHSL